MKSKAYTSERRKSYKYKQWANSVKLRDGYKCQHCGLEDVSKLQAHHIVPWQDNVELRFEISNGLTLCRVCHTKEDRRIKPIVAWNKGKKLSDDHKRKLVDAKIGHIPWNKGLKGSQVAWNKGREMPKYSEERKNKIGEFTRGRSWIIDPETGKRKWIDKENKEYQWLA